MKLLIAVLILAGSLFAQEAKVIQLSPEDATKAQALADAVKKAKAEAEAFTEHIKTEYLVVDGTSSQAGSCSVNFLTVGYASTGTTTWTPMTASDGDKQVQDVTQHETSAQRKQRKAVERWYRKGWCGEFVYSDDFKFIVPTPYSNGSGNVTWTNNCPYFLTH